MQCKQVTSFVCLPLCLSFSLSPSPLYLSHNCYLTVAEILTSIGCGPPATLAASWKVGHQPSISIVTCCIYKHLSLLVNCEQMQSMPRNSTWRVWDPVVISRQLGIHSYASLAVRHLPPSVWLIVVLVSNSTPSCRLLGLQCISLQELLLSNHEVLRTLRFLCLLTAPSSWWARMGDYWHHTAEIS